jgi:EamA domain-containing membrane protein RarD
MNSILIKAVIVVTFALISYSIAVITEQKKGKVTNRVLTFLTTGIVLDISSTVLMIIGSGKIPITLHGFIGYSALTVMLIETILIWRFRIKNGSDMPVSKALSTYTRFAYIWWVVAYIAGAIIAIVLEN